MQEESKNKTYRKMFHFYLVTSVSFFPGSLASISSPHSFSIVKFQSSTTNLCFCAT